MSKYLQQALYFQLRTSREDYLTIRAQLNNAQKREAAKSTPQGSQATLPNANGTSGSPAPAQSPSQGTPRPEGQTPADSQPQPQAQGENITCNLPYNFPLTFSTRSISELWFPCTKSTFSAAATEAMGVCGRNTSHTSHGISFTCCFDGRYRRFDQHPI